MQEIPEPDFFFIIFIFCFAAAMPGCAVIDAGTGLVKGTTALVTTTGKLGVETVKLTSKAVGATGDLVANTGKLAGKTHKFISNVPDVVGPARIIKLTRRGDSLYAGAVVNGRAKANLLLDTGATDTQISSELARKLKIPLHKGTLVPVTLAGGRQAVARSIKLKELQVGPMKVKNIDALVIEGDHAMSEDGLLGMSFLKYFEFKIDARNGELTLKKIVDMG